MQPDSERPVVDAQNFSTRPPSGIELEKTRKMPSVPPTPSGIYSQELMPIAEASHLLPATYRKKAPLPGPLPKITDKRELANIHMLQEQCRRLCLTLFTKGQSQTVVRSLGFTSSIGGEGKSFLAAVTAQLLSSDSLEPVTLVECNWDHPTLHETFGVPATPGLAEWLSGACDEQEIRYEVRDNLTIIPAGDGSREAVKLLRRIQQHGLQKVFKPNELIIFDLPAVITTSYGSLAASLVDTVVVVVRGDVTPGRMLVETCAQLKDVSIHGVILNQGRSRIPRWIRQIL